MYYPLIPQWAVNVISYFSSHISFSLMQKKKTQCSKGQKSTSKVLAGSALAGVLGRLWPSLLQFPVAACLLARGHVTQVSASVATSCICAPTLPWSLLHLFSFIFKILFYFICMGVLPECVFVHHVLAW